jgi:ABC-type polysaccharide/polyol phosphate transport system ATPase subunit
MTATRANNDGAAIAVESLVKSFRYFPSPLDRLREAFHPFGKRYHVPVPVLRDVSFTIPRGQSVAVIGANGVGKSTLLHLIAGLIEPSAGTVSANGRVIGLFGLGGSFLPDLTGRENARFFHEVVFKSGGAWEERERAIEAFAEIGEFFDRPVRTYSSGMFLRLAFAVAIAEAPDILLLDEVLAVGDIRFQQKCYRRIRELREGGTTIMLVTHNVEGLPAICDRTLLLDHGELVFDGDTAEGIDRYYQLFFMSPTRAAHDGSSDEHRYGEGGAQIATAFASRDGVEPAHHFQPGERITIVMEVIFERAVEQPHFGFNCSTKEGVRVYATATGMLGQTPAAAAAGEHRRVEITFELKAISDLFVDLSVYEQVHGAGNVLDARIGVLHLVVASPRHYAGVTDLGAVIKA